MHICMTLIQYVHCTLLSFFSQRNLTTLLLGFQLALSLCQRIETMTNKINYHNIPHKAQFNVHMYSLCIRNVSIQNYVNRCF